VGVVFYRMSVLAALYLTDNPVIYHNATVVVSVTAAIINLIAIQFLTAVSYFYQHCNAALFYAGCYLS
jgi:hypothetical protein